MLWATWTNTPLVSSLVLCSLVLLIWAVDPQIIQLNLLFVFAGLAFLISLAPERTAALLEALPGIATTLINDYHLGGLFSTNASMLFTSAAAVWFVIPPSLLLLHLYLFSPLVAIVILRIVTGYLL